MLFELIAWIFLIGFAYRVLVRFVLPMLHITRSAGDRLRQMQSRMDEMDSKMNRQAKPKTTRRESEYIEYEEVK